MRELVPPCLTIQRDSLTARVSFQFHNTEMAAAGAVAAAAVARCKVAAAYLSIFLNWRSGARLARSLEPSSRANYKKNCRSQNLKLQLRS